MRNWFLQLSFLGGMIILSHASTAENLKKLFLPDALPPDAGLNLYEFLAKYNYTYENHTIITEDHYILHAFRIPCPRYQKVCNTEHRPAVLMVHGIFVNPTDFLIKGPGHSPGFALADNGYDVWLLATRGCTYFSTQHETLDPKSFEYWDFSWHEIGVYDVPATINHIRNTTGKEKISFIGHSQGATAYMAFATARPEYNSRITVAILYAPVVLLTHAKLPGLGISIEVLPLVEAIYKTEQLRDLLPHSDGQTLLAYLLCNKYSPIKDLCVIATGFLFGYDPVQLKPEIFTVLGTQDPAGGSAKSLIQYTQNAKYEKFQQFDYGTEGNKKRYGSPVPPAYNFSNALAPIVTISALNDFLQDQKELRKIEAQLPNVTSHVVPFPYFNHIDFLFAEEIYKYVAMPTLKYMDQFNNRQN